MKTIKIGNKEVNVRSSALTSKIYRQLFDRDLMSEIAKCKNTKDVTIINMFKELAFVISWQAIERSVPISQAIKSLSIDDYIDWLEQFDESDFYDGKTITEITEVWLGNAKALVDVKNLQSLQ